MLTGSYDTTVRLWNVSTGHCDATFDGCHSSTIVCLDADFPSGFVVSGTVHRVPTPLLSGDAFGLRHEA